MESPDKVARKLFVTTANKDTPLAKESRRKRSFEDEAWLMEALSGPIPPYDWGPEGPPQTKPVVYIPGKGFVVKGSKIISP